MDPLPAHFHREEALLRQAKINGWPALAGLSDGQLRRMAGDGQASEARLIRLRGQARLVVEVGLAPPEAALLLHAGIATRAGLAEADPHRLLQQVGRFQRQLAGQALGPLSLAMVRGWIQRARQHSGRPSN
jgi:hypothetical protein